MDRRRALPWNCHIGPIKHRLVRRHIVIDNLENDAEFADNDLTRTLLAPEECEILSHSHTLDIRQLTHHLTEMDHRFTQKTRTSILLIALIRDYKGGKLQLRVLRHLRLRDW